MKKLSSAEATRSLRIDLAFAEAALQVFGGEIDVYHRIGVGENRIGYALAHFHAQELFDGVVEALEVLNVQRRDDVNAGGDDFLNVLVSLGVWAVGGVGVGELVNQRPLAAFEREWRRRPSPRR